MKKILSMTLLIALLSFGLSSCTDSDNAGDQLSTTIEGEYSGTFYLTDGNGTETQAAGSVRVQMVSQVSKTIHLDLSFKNMEELSRKALPDFTSRIIGYLSVNDGSLTRISLKSVNNGTNEVILDHVNGYIDASSMGSAFLYCEFEISYQGKLYKFKTSRTSRE